MVTIFEISISQNTKCENSVGFPKSGHKYTKVHTVFTRLNAAATISHVKKFDAATI